MQVEFCETVEVSGNATIGVEDIESALHQYESDVEHSYDINSERRHRCFAVNQLVNAAYQCLKSLNEEMISEMSLEVRSAVYDGLIEQAQRFETPVPPDPSED